MKTEPFDYEKFKAGQEAIVEDSVSTGYIGYTNVVDVVPINTKSVDGDFWVIVDSATARTIDYPAAIPFRSSGEKVSDRNTSFLLKLKAKTKTVWYCSYTLGLEDAVYTSDTTDEMESSKEQLLKKWPMAKIIEEHTVDVPVK